MKSIRSDTSSGDVIESFGKAIISLQDQDSEIVEKEEPGYRREMRNSDGGWGGDVHSIQRQNLAYFANLPGACVVCYY